MPKIDDVDTHEFVNNASSKPANRHDNVSKIIYLKSIY